MSGARPHDKARVGTPTPLYRGQRLTYLARMYAVIGALQCAAAATSLWFRPPPVIRFLPGDSPLWAVVFGAVALLLAAVAIQGGRKLSIVGFAAASTAHTMYAVGLLGMSIAEDSAWLGVAAMGMLGIVYGITAARVSGAGQAPGEPR